MSAALICPIGLALLQRVPDQVDRPMANDRTGVPAHPVEVLSVSGGEVSRLVPLWRVGPGDMSAAEQVDLLLATYGTRPELLKAEFRIGTCVFQLSAPVTPEDNALLSLTRVQPCKDESSPSAELLLVAKGEGRISWWTWEMPATNATDYQGLTLTGPDAGRPSRSIVRGRLRTIASLDGPRRAALVAWLWNDLDGRRTSAWWAGAAVMIVLGLWLLSSPASRLMTVRAALGSGLLAFGLATAWALVVPPLQAADEPDHLMSAAAVAGATHVADQLPEFARRTHFERIRFHSLERFTPVDRHSPFPIAWTGDVNVEPMDNRSPASALLWRSATPVWSQPAVADTLWRLRILHAMVFATAIAIAAALVVWCVPAIPGPGLLAGVALLPTLPYFGTMVSDWALLSSASVLFGASLLVLAHGRERVAWAGLPLGVSVALLLGSNLAGFTVLPLSAAALAGYLCVGGDRRRPLVFWGGVAIGAVLASWLLAEVAVAGYQRPDTFERPTYVAMLTAANRSLAFVGRSWWLFALALVGVAGLLDVALTRLRSHSGLNRLAKSMLAATAATIAVIACLQLAASLLWRFPQMPTFEEVPTLPVLVRAGHGLLTLLSAARLRQFDHATFTSLWGGFGWLDTMLPAPLLIAIVLGLSAGLLLTWLHLPHRARALTIIVTAGGIVSAAVTLTAVVLMQRNLHGRYLLPIVVPVTMVVMSAAGRWLWDSPSAPVRWAVGTGLALLHGCSLAWVSLRYI